MALAAKAAPTWPAATKPAYAGWENALPSADNNHHSESSNYYYQGIGSTRSVESATADFVADRQGGHSGAVLTARAGITTDVKSVSLGSFSLEGGWGSVQVGWHDEKAHE